MKKLLASFILLLMIISYLSLTSFAKGVSKVSVSNVVAETQSEVSVPIKLSNNQGLWGMVFNVYYDTNVFKLKEVVNNGDVFNSADLVIGPSDLSKGYVRVVITPSNVTSNNTENGTICTLKLNVSKNADLKKYTFKIELEDVCDIDGEDVEVNGVDGSVTVQKAAENIAQTKTQKQTATKEKTEKVIARAENNKIVEEEILDETDATESVADSEDKTENVKETEKAGENVTEEKQVLKDVSEEVQPESKSSSTDYIIYIAVVALLIVAVIVLGVVIVRRRKNK